MSIPEGQEVAVVKVDSRQLEGRAALVRDRLLRTVDALDRRRRQVVSLGAKAKSLVVPAALSVLFVAALLGTTTVMFVLMVRERRRRSVVFRAKSAMRELDVARRRPSLLRRALEKATITLVAILTGAMGRHVSKNFVDGRFPRGQLAPVPPRA
jgi:hypothetical protein